jgi:hypothetical protein
MDARCRSWARPWRKARSRNGSSVGDAIKPGDNPFEIETDAVSMEVPATVAGRWRDPRAGGQWLWSVRSSP